MKRLAFVLILLWPTLAYPGEFVGQFGPVLPWKRDHQQTTSYRSWAGEVSYQWAVSPWLRGGIEAHGLLFRFPDATTGIVIGVGPALIPHYDVGGGWSLEIPIGAALSWNDIYPRCREVSTSVNALVHAGISVRYQSVFVEIRWQHMSNAHTNAPNIGFDWIIPMVGWRF